MDNLRILDLLLLYTGLRSGLPDDDVVGDGVAVVVRRDGVVLALALQHSVEGGVNSRVDVRSLALSVVPGDFAAGMQPLRL